MSKIEFAIGFMLASDWMLEVIEVLLDKKLGYWCCTGVPQVRTMSTSVQARANRSQRQGFSGRDSCPSCGFKGHHMNLDRRNSGSGCGHPPNLEFNRGHSWDYCGPINWGLLWQRDYLPRVWGRVRNRYDWWCTRDCALQEFCNGFSCNCRSVPIS